MPKRNSEFSTSPTSVKASLQSAFCRVIFFNIQSYSAILYIQMAFHLTTLLLCNVKFYCFNIYSKSNTVVAERYTSVVFPNIFHIFEVKQHYGENRHCLRPANNFWEWLGIGLNLVFSSRHLWYIGFSCFQRKCWPFLQKVCSVQIQYHYRIKFDGPIKILSNSEYNPRAYSSLQVFFGGVKHGGGGILYMGPEFFKTIICVSRHRNGKIQKSWLRIKPC